MNRDGALQCYDRARQAVQAGDRAAALKFAQKALKLYPELTEARVLLQRLQQASQPSSGAQGAASSRETHRAASNPRRRPTSARSAPASSHARDAPVSADIAAILNARTLYDVLGIPKDASGGQIKKAYKKLALKYHPDKNQAHKAEDAFKRISHAFAVLNDEEKRAHYDQVGEEDGQPSPSSGVRRRHPGMHPESDVFAEEIFNMFFGGMHPHMRTGGVRFTRGHDPFTAARQQASAAQGEQATPLMAQLIQLAPLLLFLLLGVVNLLSFGGSSSSSASAVPKFSLHPTRSFNVELHTASRGVVQNIPYFVRSDVSVPFLNSVQQRYKLDLEVQETARQTWFRECRREYDQKQQLERQAKALAGQRAELLRNQAANMPMPSCDKYSQYFEPRSHTSRKSRSSSQH